MRILTKITLGVGVVMLIGSVLLLVIGGGSAFSNIAANPNGSEKWSGTSPTTYEGNFEVTNIYYVFVKDGATVDISVVGGDDDNRFMPCSEDSSCDSHDWPGHTYVGGISIYTAGDWEIEFTGEGDVVITETIIDMGSALSFTGGFGGICCSFCILGLGVIFIFALKDPPQQTGVLVMPPVHIPGQPVAGQAGVVQEQVQPGVLVGGAIHPAFEQQPPQTGQPPSQGF